VGCADDQSPQGNHLRAAIARRGSIDLEVNATVNPLTLGGKRVYSAYFQRVQDYPNATGGHTHGERAFPVTPCQDTHCI
jgi:hypothetical protein